MRTLTFASPADNRRYKIIHQTLVFSPTELTREELLPHGKMLALIKGIGEVDPRSLPTEDNPDPIAIYTLADDSTVILEEQQFSMLRKHFRATIPKFPKEWSSDVAAVDAWLKLIKEEVVAKRPQLVPADEPGAPAANESDED